MSLLADYDFIMSVAVDPSIVRGWPPNIKAIRAVLPVSESNIFAYGGTIYNPGCGYLPELLIAHEGVHFLQQEEIGLKRWWRLFLKDPEFRLAQELPAHRREYRVFCQNVRDRNQQAGYLQEMGRRLAAPMYGSIITAQEAIKEIRNG